MSTQEFVKDDFTVIINIDKPINFCSDPEKHALIELKNLYESKCYSSYYIVEILKIMSRSHCKFDIQSCATMTVTFKARVLRYNEYGILTDIRINDLRPAVIGENEHANVSISCKKVPRYGEIVEVGQVVPVRILKVGYENLKKISVVAYPLMPEDSVLNLNITQNLTADEAVKLMHIVNEISSEVEKRESMDPQNLEFYEGLMFRADKDAIQTSELIYEGGATWRGIAPPNAINLTNMVSRCANGEDVDFTGIWCRDVSIPKSSPLVRKLPRAVKTLNKPAYLIIENLLIDMVANLVCVRELAEANRKTENENIWFMMTN